MGINSVANRLGGGGRDKKAGFERVAAVRCTATAVAEEGAAAAAAAAALVVGGMRSDWEDKGDEPPKERPVAEAATDAVVEA
eukprot:CAMPEP_0175087908 /NCGR_PEP_ID=MMETSP0052_2-20121109/30094_1 /TAXON_ID=51329 ORGANISM="Polytomella parva, Strain SAG 63-3" /NCGR_SAMPLE_ID=MMETSP0052_2 /ASSEMBLY_ACC=CAM_ASM_000194 /LENGTH=81 /DNA_ID=CAMNT_0016360311 /DNA_START=242 /DNA_END=487 /DNA_ORIENTATION=+